MFEDSVSSIPSIWASMNSWFTPTVLFVVLNVMIGTIAITSSFANQKQPQSQQQQTEDDHNHHHRNHQQPNQLNQHHQQNSLVRSPSVLQRLKSINFYSYRLPEPHPSQPITAHFNPIPDSDTLYATEQDHHHQTPESEPQIVQFVFEPSHLGNFEAEHTQLGNLKTEQTHLANFGTDEAAAAAEEEDGFVEEEEAQSIDEVFRQLERHVDRTTSDTTPASGEVPVKLPAKMRKSASVKSAFAHFEEKDVVEARRPATVRETRTKPTDGDNEVDAKADDFINKFKQQLKLQRLDSIIRYKDVISRGTAK